MHFFDPQSEAERYYSAIEATRHSLFTSPWGEGKDFFEGLDGKHAPDGGKTLRFTAGEDATAIDQVLELIDESELSPIRSVVE